MTPALPNRLSSVLETVARGYLDYVEHVEDESEYTIIGYCEGRQLDYSKKNGRVRSTADQQRRAPGDLFFQHAGAAGRVKVDWGRTSKDRKSTRLNSSH